MQTSNFVRVRTHQSNDSYYERKHTTPCRGLDCLGAFHKSCPRLPLILPVIAMFGVGSRRDCDLCLFSQACRDANLRRSKTWRLSLLHYPSPTSDVNALPRQQIVRVPTGLCITTRLSAQPLINENDFSFSYK